MSEMEYWNGKIKKCTFPKYVETMKDKIDYRVKHHNDIIDWEYDEDDPTYLDCKTLCIVGNDLYDISELEQYDPERGEIIGKANTDGSISVQAVFYNGGCCLSEAIEQVIYQVNKENN